MPAGRPGLPCSTRPRSERGSHRRRRGGAAKAICATCDVAEVCAAYALAWREPCSTWGGLSEADREVRYASLGPGRGQHRHREALATWYRQAELAGDPLVSLSR